MISHVITVPCLDDSDLNGSSSSGNYRDVCSVGGVDHGGDSDAANGCVCGCRRITSLAILPVILPEVVPVFDDSPAVNVTLNKDKYRLFFMYIPSI